jgi:hypothetical protein
MATAITGENVLAGASSLYVSADTGANWTVTNLNSYANSFVVCRDTVFAATTDGVFYSVDDGFTWTATSLNSEVYSLAVIGDTIIAGASEDTENYLTSDNGKTWIPKGLEHYNIFDLAVCGKTIFAGGTAPLRSTDNGENWIPLSNIADILSFVVRNSTIYAGTSDGVFFSNDYGENWYPWNTGLINTDVLSLAISETDIYAGTWGKGVWKRSLSEMTGIKEIKKNEELIVYPNPSKNELTIEYSAQFSAGVVSIYNMSGQLIIKQQLTVSKSKLDISGLTKGIYLLKLSTREKTTSTKFIKE